MPSVIGHHTGLLELGESLVGHAKVEWIEGNLSDLVDLKSLGQSASDFHPGLHSSAAECWED